jgi:hypothetical protein
MPELTLPTIHLNGSSPDCLFDDYEKAATALYKALDALNKTAPNGRDYYVSGPSALAKAAAEHIDRCRRVRSVITEFQIILEHLANARDARKR